MPNVDDHFCLPLYANDPRGRKCRARRQRAARSGNGNAKMIHPGDSFCRALLLAISRKVFSCRSAARKTRARELFASADGTKQTWRSQKAARMSCLFAVSPAKAPSDRSGFRSAFAFFLSFFFSSRLRLAVESEGKRFGRETERYWLKSSIGKLNREPTRATSTRDIFPIEPQLRLPKATFGRSLGITAMLHPLA